MKAARILRTASNQGAKTLAISAEPAPYDLPPVNLQRWQIILLPKGGSGNLGGQLTTDAVVALAEGAQSPIGTDSAYEWHRIEGWPAAPHVDTPISWASAPLVIGIRRVRATAVVPQ